VLELRWRSHNWRADVTRLVFATLIEYSPQARPGEGLYRLRVQAEDRHVEVRALPIGDTPGEPWIVACADTVLQRRIGACGATVAHALAEIEDAIALWRAGRMPRIAVTGDSRDPPPPTELRPLEAWPASVPTPVSAAPASRHARLVLDAAQARRGKVPTT
jgi:hypothetical protein